MVTLPHMYYISIKPCVCSVQDCDREILSNSVSTTETQAGSQEGGDSINRQHTLMTTSKSLETLRMRMTQILHPRRRWVPFQPVCERNKHLS